VAETRDILGLSPRGCLALLRPQLDEVLITRDIVDKFASWCDSVPPIPRLALEFRLGAEGGPIDLHQKITRHDNDPEILAQWLAENSADKLGQEAAELLTDWANNHDDLQDHFPEIFLEWDAPEDKRSPALPGLFFLCDVPCERTETRSVRRDALGRVATSLGYATTDFPDAIFDQADRIFISHIGFMQGRSKAVRINVKGVTAANFQRFLESLHWPGDSASLLPRFESWLLMVDKITIAPLFSRHKRRTSRQGLVGLKGGVTTKIHLRINALGLHIAAALATRGRAAKK
jgi:hypothetical protein